MQALDWLPPLKTQPGCCCRVWKSSLAPHTSVHGVCVCIHTTAISANELTLMGVIRNQIHINPHMRQMCPDGNLQVMRVLDFLEDYGALSAERNVLGGSNLCVQRLHAQQQQRRLKSYVC